MTMPRQGPGGTSPTLCRDVRALGTTPPASGTTDNSATTLIVLFTNAIRSSFRRAGSWMVGAEGRVASVAGQRNVSGGHRRVMAPGRANSGRVQRLTHAGSKV